MKGKSSWTSLPVLESLYNDNDGTVTFSNADYQAKLSNSFWLNTGLHVGMIQ